MTRYLAKQAVTLVTLLLVASFLIFGIVYLAPGDPLSALLGNRTPDPQRVAQLKAEFHLDRPFAERYWLWLSQAFQGDLGTSTVYRTSVAHMIGRAAPTTVLLITYAEGLTILIGVGAAAAATRWQRFADPAVAAATSAGATVPTFVSAVALSTLLSVKVRLFPAGGAGAGLGGRLWHLTLPALTLAIVGSALLARVGRATMRAESESQHTATEIARGVPYGRVFRRHILRNAAPPLLAVVGLQIPGLIAGTVIVEQVFDLNGLGSLLLNGAQAHDYPVVQAIALLIVVVTVGTAVVVDLLQGVIDPRVKIGAA